MLPWLAESKVLVVEDSAQMRRIIVSMLRALGAREIHEAVDGDSAIDKITHGTPDLIILDYVMPGSDGLAVLAHIRQRNVEWSRVPVIMVTGRPTPELAAAARDGGVNELLSKPLSLTKLAEKIDGAVRIPRPFIDEDKYFGPDRRRRGSRPPGAERRKSNPRSVAV